MKIKKGDIKKEIEKIKKILDRKVVTPAIKKKLERMGYKEVCIGAGAQSYITSKQIVVKTLNNSFLKGDFLCIGIANMSYGLGTRYNAFVKEVDNGN